jgi:hypothetical protein
VKKAGYLTAFGILCWGFITWLVSDPETNGAAIGGCFGNALIWAGTGLVTAYDWINSR